MDEIDLKKEKKIALIIVASIYTILSLPVIFIIVVWYYLFSYEYYELKVDKSNRSEVIEMLKKEDKKYCNSIYKLEMRQLFPNDKSLDIYCKDEILYDGICDGCSEESNIPSYMYRYAKKKRRYKK